MGTRNARLLDLAYEPILIRDQEDRITYWNKGAERLYGFRDAEALGRVSHDLLKTQFPEEFETLRTTFLKHREWQGELTHTTRDGQQVIVSSRWVMDDDPEAGPLTLETNFDLTAVMASKAALETSEHRLRSVFQLSPLGIGIRDESTGSFEIVNEAYGRITGYSEAELLSSRTIDGPAVTGAEVERFHDLLEGRSALYRTERSFQRKSGEEIWITVFARVLDRDLLSSRIRTLIVLEDSTARRSAEMDLHRLNTTLEQRIADRTRDLAETNRDLEAFSYSVSHDLRAPLRAIRGFADALEEDYGDKLDAQARSYLAQIELGASRMAQLIDDLLAYSRLGRASIVLSKVYLADVVAKAIEQVAQLDLAPEVTVAPQICVMAHPQTLVQAVVNLLTNACKFARADVPAEIFVRAEIRGNAVRLWVEDNGIGIAPEHQERIFQVFERLHGQETYPGTGIGLAIVKRSMQQMHGSAGVESMLGTGSRFWIELPRAEEA